MASNRQDGEKLRFANIGGNRNESSQNHTWSGVDCVAKGMLRLYHCMVLLYKLSDF